jgi:hypothetical protein
VSSCGWTGHRSKSFELQALQALSGEGPEDRPAEKIEIVEQQECPWDVPEHAEPWIRKFVILLYQGLTIEAATRGIRKAPEAIKAELKRVGMPRPWDLKRGTRTVRLRTSWAGRGLGRRGCAGNSTSRTPTRGSLRP